MANPTFDEIINTIPQEAPRNSFEQIVEKIPKGKPLGFETFVPEPEKGFFDSMFEGFGKQSREEAMAQAESAIALSELSGISISEAAQQEDTLKDVYATPTIGEALKMRTEMVKNRFETSREGMDAAIEFSTAFKNQDLEAMDESQARYKAAAAAKIDDPRLGSFERWIYRSVPDLAGQIEETFEKGSGYAAAGAALGAATGPAAAAGATGGAGVGFGYGTLKAMYDMSLGTQALDKIDKGMDAQFAYLSSIPTAGILAVSERMQFNALVKNIPGVRKLLPTALASASKKVEAWTLSRAGMETMKSAGMGTAQEGAQTIIEELDKVVSAEIYNQLKGTDLKTSTIGEIVSDVKDTMIEVLPGMIVFGGAGPTMGVSAQLMNKKADDRANARDMANMVGETIQDIEGTAAAQNVEAQGETVIRDPQGNVVQPEETVPANADDIVLDGDDVSQPVSPITQKERVAAEARIDTPSVTDQQFDDLVMAEDLDAAVDQVLNEVEGTGDVYGDFVSNLREALGAEQAGVVEGVIAARARATNRTPDQFAAEHGLKFSVEEDPTGSKRASVEFIEDGQTVIRAFQAANMRDVTHEVAHVFMKDMSAEERGAAESAFGVKNGEWTTQNIEDYAESFVEYLSSGETKNAELAGLFDKFKVWLGEIFASVKESGAKVSPQMQQLFDLMLAPQLNAEYQHKMSQSKTATEEFFSGEQTEQLKNKDFATEQAARLEKIISDKAALREALKNKVLTARQAAAMGNEIGYNEAKADALAIANRAKTRSTLTKERRRVIKRIEKRVKDTKPKTSKGGPKGKFTAGFQETADILRSVFSMPVKEAKEKVASWDYEAVPDDFGSDMKSLERWLTRIRANSNMMTPSILRQLDDDLKNALENEVSLRQAELKPLMDRVQAANTTIQESLRNVRERKGQDPDMRDTYENHASALTKLVDTVKNTALLDFHGLMEMLDMGMDSLFGEGYITRFSETLDMENQSNTGRDLAKTAFLNDAASIYGMYKEDGTPDIKGAERKFWEEEREDKVKVWEFEELDSEGMPTGKRRELFLNKASARKLWMELQDPDILELYTDAGVTDSNIRALRGMLTNEDVNFVMKQLEIYDSYYDKVNAIYRLDRGVNLPRNRAYSPILRDVTLGSQEGQLSDLLKDMNTPHKQRDAGTGELKSRVKSKDLLKPRSDIAVMDSYIRHMEHYMAFAEHVRGLNMVFGNKAVQEAIRDTYGKRYLEIVNKLIKNIARNGGENKELNIFDKMLKNVRANLARGMVGAKVLAIPKQMTSFLAFSEQENMSDFSGKIAEFLKNPRKNAAQMKEWSQFVQNRTNTIDRDMALIERTTEYKDIIGGLVGPNFNNMVMMFVKAGDISAIYAGMYAKYQLLIERGVPHDEAIREVELTARNTQQSNELGSMSAAQQGSEFMRAMTMFTSSQRQYVQRAILTLEAQKAGRASKAQLTKNAILYGVALPTLFQIVSQAGFDDEEDFRGAARAIMVSPIQPIPIAGSIWEFAVNKMILGHTFGRGVQLSAVSSPVERTMKGMDKMGRLWDGSAEGKEITMRDITVAARDLAAVGEYFGVPVGGIGNVAVGAMDVMEGEAMRGAGEIAGMSPYTAERFSELSPMNIKDKE